ncbi:unnamed protein product, partial [marine sediment metagenome]
RVNYDYGCNRVPEQIEDQESQPHTHSKAKTEHC